MQRRKLVVGLGGLATFGVAAFYGLGRSRRKDTGSRAAVTPNHRASGPPIDPVMIDLIDTQYSTDSMQAVPGNGSVTVIDMFATWCVGCEEQFRNLAAVHERVPGSVEFVSVSNEALGGSLSRADIREYWKHHAGEWSVGLDNNGALTRRLGVNGLPFTVVTNPDRHVVLAARGTTDPSVVEAAITKARHQ